MYEKRLPVPYIIIKSDFFHDPCWTTGVITLERNTIVYNHAEATFDKQNSFVFFSSEVFTDCVYVHTQK